MDEILIVAGENSGDLHAAGIIKSFTSFHPDFHFFGSGGDRMKAAGVELLAHVNELAVMGFSGIPRILPTLASLKKKLLTRVHNNNVKLVILVDYPGFNLSLARSLKLLPHPPRILEYIAPQVWAWRANRISKIRRYIDHLAVVFPFEEALFKSANIPVTFVGHPLLDEMNLPEYIIAGSHDKYNTGSHNLSVDASSSTQILALLPGSRKSVVGRHLPIMLESARLLMPEFPDIRIGIGCAPGLHKFIENTTRDRIPKIEFWDDSRTLLSQAAAAVVCSGTATLEAALLGTPQVVVYKTSSVNYHVVKNLIRLPNVGLVNIVAGEKIVPELLQYEFNPISVQRSIAPLLRHANIRDHIRLKLLKLRAMLGEPGAALKVADLAYGMITNS